MDGFSIHITWSEGAAFLNVLFWDQWGSDLPWPVENVPVIIYFRWVRSVALSFSHISLRLSNQGLIGFRLLQLKTLFSLDLNLFAVQTRFQPLWSHCFWFHRDRGLWLSSRTGVLIIKKRRAFSDHILRLHPKHGTSIKNVPVGIQHIWTPEVLRQQSLLSQSSCLENSEEKETEQTVKPAALSLFFPADITSL